MNGTVRALFVKLEKGAKSVPRDSVQAGLGGFDGDHHTENSKRRQILLISGSVIDQLHLQPGNVYENVVVDGLDVMTLREGQRLRLGDALVAVTIPCEPCIQMERMRTGLQEALRNQRGMFVTVLEPGIVRVGDAVCGESAVESSLKR
ncbi:MAG: MOSC domain-containing protein [Acidobacteria bacterium]|nr:MAG: MOSC domain-containing protein [Acidobacteriota bacterium]PYS14533.1 MAG: MOSC domain-containing protein [Acidobacteriota bacterium]